MIVTMIGAAGGVGTSTLGLLLSVALQERADADRETVFLEADPSGGVTGARFDLGINSGLQAWVAGLATDPTVSVAQFGTCISDRLRVVPAPVSWADTERVLTPVVTDMLATTMTTDSERSWVVDVGRGGGASSSLAGVADVAVIVSPGLPEHVVRLSSMVTAVRPVPCVVMVTGQSTWPTGEIQRHCEAEAVLGGPEFRLTADQVVDLVEGRKRRRSLPWRSVLQCRDTVVETAATNQSRPENSTATTRSAR